MHYIFQSHQLIDIFQSLRNENHPRLGNRTERKEAGLLGPTKSRLGQTWPSLALMGRRGASWAQLEASWPQLGPNLSPTRVQHGATWACLDASWGLYAQLGPVWRHLARKLGPMSPSKPKDVGNSGKNASFQRVTLSPQNCPGWARLPQKGCQLGQVALS